MAKTFFISDTHFGHANILKLGAGRPFASIWEHDETIIANWNRVVGPEDSVYHLGDFSYRNTDPMAVFARLNGVKHLITGNHDEAETLGLPWASVRPYVEDRLPENSNGKKHRVVLCHYPMQEWAGFWKRDSAPIHLHGHTHGCVPGWRRRQDMAVDVWDYTPQSLDAIIKRLASNPDINPQTLLPFEVADE